MMEKQTNQFNVLAKPSCRMIRINYEDVPGFIKRFNDNIMSPEMISSCKIAGRLFRNKEK